MSHARGLRRYSRQPGLRALRSLGFEPTQAGFVGSHRDHWTLIYRNFIVQRSPVIPFLAPVLNPEFESHLFVLSASCSQEARASVCIYTATSHGSPRNCYFKFPTPVFTKSCNGANDGHFLRTVARFKCFAIAAFIVAWL